MVVLSILSGKKLYVKEQFDFMFVCTTVLYVVCNLPHSGKYDLLNIDKTNISLRFKENMINFYLYYLNWWFTRSDSWKHR